MGIITKLRRIGQHRSAELDDRTEKLGAATCDANLARLKHSDPDAERIFATAGTTPFGDAYRDPRLADELAERLRQYASAKNAAGRMDLYNALFAGLGA